jgi:site-specific recombinase XerD
LGQYLDLYASQLAEQGYASTTAYLLIRVAGGFSQWLKRNNIAIQSITNEAAIRYLSCRAKSHSPSGSEAAALKRMLNILYEAGVIQKPIVMQTQANQFTLEFASYLRDERALSESTINRLMRYCLHTKE